MTRSEHAGGGFGLDRELRSLAASLAMPAADDQTVGAVMARLDREPVPSTPGLPERAGEAIASLRRWLRNRWRITSVVLAATLVLLLGVTPAGAKVREWLGLGAVVIEQQQSVPAVDVSASGTAAAPSPAGDPPTGRELPLQQAIAETSFTVGVPAVLGEPDRVTVSDDARVVSMQWLDTPSGNVRLDQIGRALAPYFAKTYYQDVEPTVVNGARALWLARPHPVLVLNPDGSERAESARQSGPSLVWQDGDVTLRLEGVNDRQAAVAIAESLPN